MRTRRRLQGARARFNLSEGTLNKEFRLNKGIQQKSIFAKWGYPPVARLHDDLPVVMGGVFFRLYRGQVKV